MKRMKMILIFAMLFMSLSAPPVRTMMVFHSPEITPFEKLWDATCRIESNYNPLAIGDKHLKEWSYGIVQVRRSRLSDYYRQTGVIYSTEDMFDPGKAKEVFMWYASQYKHYELEEISRSWNGGSRGMQKKSTKKYWNRIKANL